MSDSEDSDGEGGLGNLNRMVMRPAGHSGKAKKGHLCFDASFETGNLGRVDLISEFEYDLFIRPDTCSPKIRMWFNFVVDNAKQDQRVIFNIVNFGKYRNLYNTEMTPIVKSSSRPKWQRIMRRNVFYHRSIYHRFRHILSFSFAFDREEDVYHFALATPYSYSKLQAYLEAWTKKAKHLKGVINREVIGKTVQKRKVDLITIGDEEAETDNEDKKKKEKRRVVVIIARTHGGEPPSSFVCQGLMDFLISSHWMAQLLRKNVTFKIIPMLNPDGVHLGNQRSTLMGFDLNRSWHMISEWAHPTLKVTADMISDIEAKKDLYQIDFIIDIHAHSSLKGCFMYGNSYEDVYRYERHVVFPKIFATKAEGYCLGNVLFNADSSKIGTARRYFCNNLEKNSNAFTLQVSLGGYHLPNLPHYIHYNDEAYLRLGRNLGKSLYEYYKQVNIIIPPVKSTDKKRGRKSRRHKGNKVRQHHSKSPATPRAQQFLEPRIFSASIIGPEINLEQNHYANISQTPLYEYPAIQTKVYSKRMSAFQRSVIPEDEKLPAKINLIGRISPIPSLSIIDLNNTIRNGLKDSISKKLLINKLSKVDERNLKKKEYLKYKLNMKNMKSDLFSSDEDYVE